MGSLEPGVGWWVWAEFYAQGEDGSLQMDAPFCADGRVGLSSCRMSSMQQPPAPAALRANRGQLRSQTPFSVDLHKASYLNKIPQGRCSGEFQTGWS